MKKTLLTSRMSLEEYILSLRDSELPLLVNNKSLFEKAKTLIKIEVEDQIETEGVVRVQQQRLSS